MNSIDVQDTNSQIRSKLIQVFRYVQAFDHLQNKPQQEIENQPWVLWFHDLPAHPCIRLNRQQGDSQLDDTLQAKQQDADEVDQDFILKVRRPQLTEPPVPPQELAPWLQNGWQNVDGSIALDPKKVAQFNANPDLQRRFSEWKVRRDRWAQQERPQRKVMDIFENLATLRSRLMRESERLELMVGDGLLSWYPPNSSGVHHPLVLLRLQLQFDPRIPEFTLAETELPSELYTALFQALPGINATDIGRSRQDFEQNHWHPLEGDETSQFLKQFVNQLSSRGEFLAQASAQNKRATPLITRDPVFFLRNRALGFSTAIESILTSLPTTTHLPHSLARLIGIDTQSQTGQTNFSASPPSFASSNSEDGQILFSKPANAEQMDIAYHLASHGAVLVQGPPGTGKTHTIANLIGHLLAQGKSVLVTSHTPKALKVLRDKVVSPLQPLCVSIMEDGSRKQMEHAIDAITERLASLRKDTLDREARQLTQQRLNLLVQLKKTSEELKEARGSEYQAIIIAGQQYSPTEAARYIARHRTDAAWLPGPVQPGIALPLSLEDLVRLYQTNALVSSQDEQELIVGLPDKDSLLASAEFARLVRDQEQLRKEDLQHRRELWQPIAVPDKPEAFQAILAQLTQALELLQNNTRWQRTIILAGCEGGPRRQIWEDLIAKIQGVDALAANTHGLLLEFHPTIAKDCPVDAEKTLSEIIIYLEKHEKLGSLTLLSHKKWKVLLEKVQVQGRAPERKEHFQALQALLQLQSVRADLSSRWQRQMTVLDAPDLNVPGPAPEQFYKRYLYQMHQALQWYPDTWHPLENALKQQGFLWERLLGEIPISMDEHSDLLRLREAVQGRLPAILVAESNRRLYARNEATLQKLQHFMEQAYSTNGQSEMVQMLREAVHNRSVQHYELAWKRLSELYERQSTLRLRHELLMKLEKGAPGWAAALRRRDGIHGHYEIPSHIEEAWLWQQLSAELDRRSQTSLETLQERIVLLKENLQKTTIALVEKKAWAAQVQRTTLEQRQALQGWKETMRKVGKGTGKRAPRLQAEARKLISICQTAVPVWIMPLSHVVQNFDPQRNRFDVVIIDEASQSDIKALAAIYMGHQIIVVGDDEQVTPLAVGQDTQDTERLIDEHLHGIPNAHLYDGRLSIYALAKTSGFEVICLREHFRCVTPIIQFSNMLSYNGKIKPLRDDSNVTRKPSLVPYRVKSAGTTGNINEEEAQTVASLLVAATEQSEYKEATFGVISMVKEEQALRIDTLLRNHLSPIDYIQRQILCGNPAQFQGDERDVIFISMVDSPGEGPLTLRTEDGFDYMYKKRYNVAVSRARDQLWVVHSLDPDSDLKNGDIRKRLIRYAMNPQAFMQNAEAEKKTDSEFEERVMKRLLQAGYHVIPQWSVGSYRIDLVIEGAGKRLAVECDGDRWHTLENLDDDMARQAILERLGWRFVRIRGSQFFRDPDKAVEPVFARLRELEIPAEGVQASVPSNPTRQVLQETIVRRAVELRREWGQPLAQASSSISAPVVPLRRSPAENKL
jgi:very-short-patch-repair endonuclease